MILPDDTPASPSKLHPENPLPVGRAVPEHQSLPPPAYPGPANRLPQPASPHSPHSLASPSSSSSSRPGYASYQATQPIYIRVDPSNSTLPLNRFPGDEYAHACRKAARRRFFRSFAIALLIYIVFVTFVSTLLGISIKGRWINIPQQKLPRTTIPSEPFPEDGEIDWCVTGPIGWEEKKGLRLTSLELPLSAEGIYLFSRAVGVSGSVKIEQDASLHDRHSMVVDIGVPMMTSDRLGSLKVCRLERKGQKGVGIFSSSWYSDAHPIFHLVVTVRVPKNLNEQIYIPSFTSNMPNFSYDLAGVGPEISFGAFSLKTSNERISVKNGVQAHNASFETSNAGIEGVFFVQGSLDLITTNHHIEAGITVHNHDETVPNRLNLKTSNARLAAAIYLFSAKDNHNGAFDITASTTNGPLAISFPAQPVNSTLKLRATSQNSLANIYLHRAFEGRFVVQSKNGRHIIEGDESAEAPDGDRKKRRDLKTAVYRDKTVGSVAWVGIDEKMPEDEEDERRRVEAKGDVEIGTVNGPAMLKFM